MCTQPVKILRTINNRKYLDEVPCGKCAECMKSQQNFWYLRFLEESKQWKYVYFVTYTYDNDHIPYTTISTSFLEKKSDKDEYEDVLWKALQVVKDGLSKLPQTKALSYNRAHPTRWNAYLDFKRLSFDTPIPCFNKDDISGHVKRMRANYQKEYGCPLEMKYFFQGEYGPATLRPHWHGLIFTNTSYYYWVDMFRKDWQKYYGKDTRVDIQPARNDSAVSRYVAKYVCKPQEFESPYVRAKFLPPAPRLISKGIGREYREKSATIEVQREIASVNDVEEYERVAKLYFYYYLVTSKGTFGYKKPRYWLELLMPCVTEEHHRVVRVRAGTSKVVSSKSYCFLIHVLGYEDENEMFSYKSVSVHYRRIDRDCGFGKARENFISMRQTARDREYLYKAKQAYPNADYASLVELALIMSRNELLARDVSAKCKHAQFYQKNYLQSEF